jgi:hypothetical protein
MEPSPRILRALWALLLAAAFLVRAWWPGTVPFRLDEAITASFAAKIATGREFPLRGLRTSFGWHNPPTTFYLAAAPFAATRDPRLATLLLAALGASAAAAAGGVVSRFAGPAAGLAAGAIIAFCPNAIEHSRRLWGHDLMIPLAAWHLWCLCRSELRARDAIAGGALAAIAQTIHLSGALLWLSWLAALPRLPRRDAFAAAAACLALAGALYLPWLVETARRGWDDLAAIRGTLAQGPSLAEPHAVAPSAAWAFVLGDSLHEDFHRQTRPFDLPGAAGALSLAANLGGVALLGAALVAAARLRERALLPAVAVLAAPLAAFGVVMRAAVPPYLIVGIPGAAVLAALLIAKAPRRALIAGAAAWAIAGGGAPLALRAEVRRAPELAAPTVDGLAEIVSSLRMESAPFAVRQDTRSRAAGPDVALVYAWFWRTSEARLPVAWEPGMPLCVIRDPEFRVHPRLDLFLLRQPGREAGGRRIARLEGEAAAAWIDLIDQGPPAP